MDIDLIGSFVVTIIGCVGFILAGKKIWWAWYVNIANQILWAVFAIVTEQWGFLVGIPLYLFVFIKNAVEWTDEEHNKDWRANRMNETLGYVSKVVNSDAGIRVEGNLTPEAAEILKRDWIEKWGVKIQESKEVPKGVVHFAAEDNVLDKITLPIVDDLKSGTEDWAKSVTWKKELLERLEKEKLDEELRSMSRVRELYGLAEAALERDPIHATVDENRPECMHTRFGDEYGHDKVDPEYCSRCWAEMPAPTEDTHDIYAWTEHHNGKHRPVVNCSVPEFPFEPILTGIDEGTGEPFIKERERIIYFFGPKENRG